MKVFQIWFHDYMDVKPSNVFYTFPTQEAADEYIKHVRDNWSGGTISDAKLLSKEEVLALADIAHWEKEEVLKLLETCDYE